MAEREKMVCPDCGVEMNLHAEKVDYTRAPEGAEASAEGLISEFHTCPACGRARARDAE
jgi:ribosomal protein S27AE